MAARCTATVLLLQISVLLVFILDYSEPPQNGRLWQALWALQHKPSFIPVVGLAVIGPPATWLAWTTRGRHRRWLTGGWICFGAAASIWFARRIIITLQLTWQYGAS